MNGKGSSTMSPLVIEGSQGKKLLLEFLARSRLIPALVGIVLLAAAFLKGYELATEELDEKGFLGARWFLVLLVLFESAMGLWLLVGLHAQVTRWVTTLMFVAFFQLALYLGLSATPSCRCLGLLRVSPWFAAVFDLCVLCALLAWRPALNGPTIFTHRRRFAGVLVLFVLAAIPALVNMVNYTPNGPTVGLRKDPQLATRMKLQVKKVDLRQLLEELQGATGLTFTLEDALANRAKHEPLAFGEINTQTARAWAIMEFIAKRQPVPSRWRAVEGGYRLERTLPWGAEWFIFWLISAAALLGIALVLMLSRLKSWARAQQVHKPSPIGWGSLKNLLRSIWQPALLAMVGCLISFCFGAAWFGSASTAIAYWRGYPICAEPPTICLGKIPAGQKTFAHYRLRNLTSRPVTIIGAQTSSRCAVSSELPLTIPAREERQLAIFVKPAQQMVGQDFEQSAELFLDEPGPRPLLTITANVAPGTALDP